MSDDKFKQIREKHALNLTGCVSSRPKIKQVDVKGSVTVSGGKTTYSEFSLVAVDVYTVVLHHHKNSFPNNRDWHTEWDFGTGRNYAWVKVKCKEHINIIQRALSSWEQHKNSSLTGYTWIVAYCLALGLDLVREGYIGK